MSACEAAWSDIREHHTQLPEVVIVLGSGVERGRLVKLGHWWGGRWLADGEVRGEVLLAGEALHLPADKVFEVLLHEAAHGLNAARDQGHQPRRALPQPAVRRDGARSAPRRPCDAAVRAGRHDAERRRRGPLRPDDRPARRGHSDRPATGARRSHRSRGRTGDRGPFRRRRWRGVEDEGFARRGVRLRTQAADGAVGARARAGRLRAVRQRVLHGGEVGGVPRW